MPAATPPTELFAPATWEQIIAVMSIPEMRIGLAGPPGIGKTAGAFDTAKRLGRRAEKVQCHSELAPSEALGMHVPDENSFRWEMGPIDVCYSSGGILILDEIVEASGPVKTFLYGALDRGPGGTISYVGKTFRQRPGYGVIATTNEYPDMGGLPTALLDRFDAWFVVVEPAPSLLQMLEPDLRQICRDSYKTARDPMAGPSITFRMLLSLQRLRVIPVLTREQAVFSACYSNKTLAASLFEILQMLKPEDIEDDSDVVAIADDEPDNALADGTDIEQDLESAEHPLDCTCEDCEWGAEDDDDDDGIAS